MMEGEEEGDKEVPGTFVRGSENPIFSRAEKEANSKRHPSAMAARTHMHTHFLRFAKTMRCGEHGSHTKHTPAIYKIRKAAASKAQSRFYQQGFN